MDLVLAVLSLLVYQDDPMRWACLMPDPATARDCFELNIAFGHKLKQAIEVRPSRELNRLAQINARHHQFWCEANFFHACGDVRMAHIQATKRKSILACIACIGWENFIRQQWPEPFPR